MSVSVNNNSFSMVKSWTSEKQGLEDEEFNFVKIKF